ncbi:hypothetical protein LTR95_013372 [Oleoguttula sp. CCFEE 5521]
MVGRGYAIAGPIAATAFAFVTIYTSLGPELAKQAAERDGLPVDNVPASQSQDGENSRDTVISRAIASDFKQAAAELKAPAKPGGFAWKLRERIWGSGKPNDGVVAMTGEDEVQEMREEKT